LIPPCINSLTPELPQHGVPDLELPDQHYFLQFFSKFPSRYFSFTGINQRPTGRYFGNL